ncbi:ADP-L-glycero-D-manno-heptose-6-epimerase [Komagataeibacter europaeus]|uniref:ADP-L-glycero-D-manno-heptose-6-epimerase n=1 Tax=Komagataeibacter europaeus TaxID=33995 RepID=A0A0M0EJA4_KOMEU|nr:ADP-glyceromanno-heptose 6-epimerase [Komagataeibacter europaeus]KON64996.1 ADP-L-glycero-D-manno-heptose-6-epimerase [Komagataeibacter europaeus]
MILITGGSGFIGSYLQAEIHARGGETVIVDWLGHEGKWRNLQRHAPSRVISPENLDAFLASDPDIKAVFHMGAISETTATDGDLVWQTNVTLSQKLWSWCAEKDISFIYASSAATYGAASTRSEFSDSLSNVDNLRPLNLYGWSKHVFDQWVVKQLQDGKKTPKQWAGLKFFNVYGPNEYHKGKMISVVKVKYDDILKGGPAKLFKSDTSAVADGQQARDFIWVGDVANVMLWLYENPHVSGLFNCGTGIARTYLDLAYAVCDSLGVSRAVEFIDMPAQLRGNYQNFTCADMRKIRDAGYEKEFTSLEDGINIYINKFLKGPMYI